MEFVIIAAFIFIAWFGPLVIWPYGRALYYSHSPPFFAAVTLCFTVTTLLWVLVISDKLTILVAALPPGFAVFSVIEAWNLNLFPLIVSTTFLLVISGAVLYKSSGLSRGILSIFLALPIVAAPIFIQGYFSEKRMYLRSVEIGADCITIRSFRNSLKHYGNPYQSFHALARRGDKVFAWSYRKNDWDKLSPTEHEKFKYFSPDPSCR